MRIGILPVGDISQEVLLTLEKNLSKVFPDSVCSVISEVLAVPKIAYDKKRKQYNSTVILNDVRSYAIQKPEFHKVLGVVDLDVFSFGLNYVFGEAYVSGCTALISLWRLKPDFYGEQGASDSLFVRTLKEAVHEIGHTLGLDHCRRGLCVMRFSNSIFDTDKKQGLFCGECYLQASIAISRFG